MDQQNQNGTKMYTPDTQISKSEKKSENILVFARVRPVNDHERSKNATVVLDCPGSREITVRERNMGGLSKTFTFDKVFGPHSKQIDVYKAVVAPLLEEVLLGYNCTVFAYGQTGTGKTFTMEGERSPFRTLTWESDPSAGIVPRAMSQLFDELRVATSEFTVRVSLVEMYNEEVYDLLSPTEDSKPKTVRLYEDSARKGSVHIQGLEEVIVRNKHEVYAIMERGSQMRKTASTLLNANSSRSHTVFTVTVHIKESSVLGEDLLKIGKLHLVDLAGSENIGRSGAVDKRAREAGNINQSLLTLGRVITALVERAPHVPYRESKLTRLLQDSLGGRTKTSIIATVSPASINLEETLSTLDYAHRAKNIQNRPEVNQKLTKKAMLKEYTEEIERLRKDLIAAREKNGIFVDKENYERMMSQIESQSQDLTDKIQYTRNLEEQCQLKETEMSEIKAVLTETKEDLTAANAVITDLRTNNSNLTAKLEEVEVKKEEMEHLVIAHSQTEKKLSTEASKLLSTATESTLSLDVLHNRLERKKGVEKANLEAGKRFCSDFHGQLSTLAEDLKVFREAHATFCGGQRMQLQDFLSDKENKFKEIDLGLQTFGSNVEGLQAEIVKITAQENTERTDFKAELTANVSNVKETCIESLTQFMSGKLLPQAHELRNNVEALRGDVNAIDTIISEYIVSNGQVAEDFIKGRLEYLEKQMVDMEGIKELYRCHLESIYQDFLRQKIERLERADKIATVAKIASDNAQLAINMAKEMEGICAQEESNMLKGYYNRQCEFNAAADKIYGNIDDASRSVKGFPQDLEQLSTAVSSTVRCKVDLANEALNKQDSLLSKTSKDVQEVVDAEKENWKNYEAEFTTILNYRMGEVEQYRGQVTDLCTKVGATHKEQVSQTKQKLGICIENDRNYVQQRGVEIFNHNDAVSTSAEEIANNLYMQCGKLNEFWDSTYLIDTPTGATPQRKAYEFPRNLSATSPHEKILERIRRFRL